MINLTGRKKKVALVFGYALISTFLLCSLGFASGGAEHGGAHDNAKLTDLLYRCINFTLLVIILVVIIKKTAIKDFFSTRREEIKKKFDDLRKDREKTERRCQELENRLNEFETKKKEIIEQFKTEGITEKEKIIDEANQRAAHILAQADLTIERELQAARDRLREEVVDISAKKAQEIIIKQIKVSDQDHLVNEFIDMVEKLH